MSPRSLVIRSLSDPGDELDTIRTLFREYADSLGVDLSFQDFEAELAGLPGDYAAPHGRVLLAVLDGRTAGCVALRRLSEGICEMKRLFIRPEFRGEGIGVLLVKCVISEARRLGYGVMRLDTLPSMQAARALYENFGFRPIEPYRHNPIPGAVFMERDLTPLDLMRQEGDP